MRAGSVVETIGRYVGEAKKNCLCTPPTRPKPLPDIAPQDRTFFLFFLDDWFKIAYS